MRLREIFRFELAYQARRASTWLYVVALLGFAYRIATEAYVENARSGGYFFNAPFVVATVTLLGSVVALLAIAAFAGDAAARDVRTRLHPLMYAAPVSRGAYLGGRFLAAFTLGALLLLVLPLALLLATLAPEPALLGPFRPAGYVGAYLVFALPNAFVATALLFSLAALTRRTMASYVGAVLLLVAGIFCWQVLAGELGRWELAKMLDPLGLAVMSEMSRTWSSTEKGTRLVTLEGSLGANRLLWMGVALAALALTWRRFRLAHPASESKRGATTDAGAAAAPSRDAPIAVPHVRRAFGAATRARQALAVAGEAFREVVLGWGGLGFAALAAMLVVAGPGSIEHLGVPLLPTTAHLTATLLDTGDPFWMLIPLLVAYYAAELVWRERDAGLSAIADAAPAPDWVLLAGKLAGLGLALAALQTLLMGAAMLVQARLGYHDFEPGLYARIVFGMQLPDHLLFAAIAVAVHVLVDQKYVGHLLVILVFAFRAFAPALGIEQPLLVYGSDPGWSYSDMRGFGPTLAPFVWFKLYWAAWALLLALVARLFWVRGAERDLASRLRLARRRLTRRVVGASAMGVGLVLALGGFVFANTPGREGSATAQDDRRAEYERRYARYAGAAQPRLAGVSVRVELHPARREAEAVGSYRLVNAGATPIDTVHVATVARVATESLAFDRPAALALADDRLGHRIYALATPLRPGDSLRLRFAVRIAPRGLATRASDAAVTANGTFVDGRDWLPAIGYQRGRELDAPGARRVHGLPPRPAVAALHDTAAWSDLGEDERIDFEAIVGTDTGQTAVAPGALRRTWTAGGRRWFHYVADAPIRREFAFKSAAYAVREATWQDPDAGRAVAIRVLHHPAHARHAARTVASVRASLAYLTRRLGPYPYGELRLVERPGGGITLHASPIDMWYQEGFTLLDPTHDPRGIDFPFAVVAHEVAHQWWGNQLEPAPVEGRALLSESLAWYSAMGVVGATYGPEHLARLVAVLREAYLLPRAQGDVPLLRASDSFLAYRKGPLAMYALREYVGEARVSAALRRLFERHRDGVPPLPTSLDLYRELEAVTPDSLRPLLADLFTRNAYWELATRRAVAERAADGAWRVALDVRARKTVVDSAGAARDLPVDDLVEIGVYAAASGDTPGAPLYRRMHRIRAGDQRIVVTVPREPGRAGIDPRGLLIDVKPGDNVREVARGAVP